MSVNDMIWIIPAEAEKSTNFRLLISSLFIFPCAYHTGNRWIVPIRAWTELVCSFVSCAFGFHYHYNYSVIGVFKYVIIIYMLHGLT